MKQHISVIFEDNHLLVLNKPPRLATMGTAEDEPSLVRWAKDYIGNKYNKPGNVYIGVVSRLDSMTSGLIVLARTSKAAARLNQQFHDNTVQKFYLAALAQAPTVPHIKHNREPAAGGNLRLGSETKVTSDPSAGTSDAHSVVGANRTDGATDRSDGLAIDWDGQWEDWIWKDDSKHRMFAAVPERNFRQPSHSKLGQLRWKLLGHNSDAAVVLVRLKSGRKHQIRVQFSSRGLPVLGDRKYESDRGFPDGIALHAWTLGFVHPVSKESLSFQIPPPASWNSLGGLRSAVTIGAAPSRTGALVGAFNQRGDQRVGLDEILGQLRT